MYHFAKPLVYKSGSDVYLIGKFEIITFLWVRLSIIFGLLAFFTGLGFLGYYYYTQSSQDFWGYSDSTVASKELELQSSQKLFSDQMDKLKWANSQIRPAHILDVLSVIKVPMVKQLDSGILSENIPDKVISGSDIITKKEQIQNLIDRTGLYPSYQLNSFELTQEFPGRVRAKGRRASTTILTQPPLVSYTMQFKWKFDSKSAVRALPDVTNATALLMRPDFNGDVFVPWVPEFKFDQSSGTKEGVYRFGLDARGVVALPNDKLFQTQQGKTVKDMMSSYLKFYSNIQEAVSEISKN
jgi:hypothetical protein